MRCPVPRYVQPANRSGDGSIIGAKPLPAPPLSQEEKP